MRTLLLLGVAAVAALSSQPAKSATTGLGDSDAAHAAPLSNPLASPAAFTPQSGTDYTPPAYRGDTDRGSPYRGDAGFDYSYSESYEGDGYTPPPYPQDYDPNRSYRYDRRYSDAEMARMCRSDDGVGGAAIGGVAGAVVGNRVAGRGNRTAGTIIGAGVGAVAGALADKEEDRQRCREYQRRVAYEREYRDYYDRYYRDQNGGNSYYGNGYGNGYYGNGYGYYEGSSYAAPETVVRTEYVPYTTTVTTTETSYDYSYPQARTSRVLGKKRVRAKRPAVKRPAVKRPACICK